MGKDLIIIGNGFDLYCGLHTKFSDFFKYSKEHNSFYRSFLDNVINDARNYAFLNPEHAYTNGILPKFSSEFSFIDAIFLLLSTGREIDYWNHIETYLYEMIVNNRPISLNKISNSVSSNKIFSEPASMLGLSKEEKLLTVMVNAKIYSPNFYNEYLLEQLNYFEQRFADYVYSQISTEQQISRYKNEARNCLSRIFDPVGGQYSPDKNDSGSIICSFNYIDISKMGLDEFDVEYVHGSLKNNDLIIGISDKKRSPLYDKLTKSKRRFLINHNRFNYKDVTNVRLFGHSFNKQDYYYYFVLFKEIDLVNRYKDITFHILYAQHDGVEIEKIRKQNVDNFADMLEEYFVNVVHEPNLLDSVAANVVSEDITKH